MKVQFKRGETTLGAVVVIAILMLSAGWILTGCQAATPTPMPTATVTPMPTATATPMPTATATPMPTATATPMPTATATPNVAATQTAQAQASITAQAAASATVQAQVGATIAAQRAGAATVQAQQTAAAMATAQFANVFADTLTKSAKKVFGPAEGMIDQSQVPGVRPPWMFNSVVWTNDFIAEARLFNPPVAGDLAWDYGLQFRFRLPQPGAGTTCPTLDVVFVRSDRSYVANFASGKPLPGSGCEQKTLVRGTLSNLDVSPTGSNLLRLVVSDKMAIFYVNGQYQTTFDTSDLIEAGGVFVRTGMTMQTPLPVRFTDFTVWTFQ